MKLLVVVPALVVVVWFTGNGTRLFEFCAHQIGRQISHHIHQPHQPGKPIQMGTTP